MSSATWHLITGEYPPDIGGVADYTGLVASGLAATGCDVHVWCPGACDKPVAASPRLTVHRATGRYGPTGLRRLNRLINGFCGPRIVAVQYTPHAFGTYAMNVPFCLWLLWRRVGHRDDIRIMFHEVAFPFVRRPLKHNLIAVANRIMAAILLLACRQTYVATPAWKAVLNRYGGRRRPCTWIPVPANIANELRPDAALAIRKRFKGDESVQLVGHFGTYQPLVTALLRPVLERLLTELEIHVLLLGRGAERFRADFVAARPEWAGRIFAGDGLPGDTLAVHLQACDLMVQPYPDGINTRRGSAMACLANGVPMITNLGDHSEPLWSEEVVTAVAPAADANLIAEMALILLADASKRAAIGKYGREYYQAHFSLARTTQRYLDDSSN